MATFSTIYKHFEDTRDICDFCKEYYTDSVAIRFLLIRSLDKPNLQDIIKQYSKSNTSGGIKDLTEKAYNSTVTINNLIDYIESKRPEILRKRTTELVGLTNILSSFPVVNCGIKSDKVDDIVKQLVRDKKLKSMEELSNQIENSVIPRIRKYILWSYYNQTCNDIIELFFLKHPKIIPTLRKIHDIDFFIKIDGVIIPFDLKFTHISDAYFDIYSRGLIKRTKTYDNFDDYDVPDTEDEIKKIKAFYSLHKRDWNLPNFERKTKIELLDIIGHLNYQCASDFIAEIMKERSKLITDTENDLHPLEWWNYKYQGERLFCNNNRFFIFLAYRDQFIDGRPLKGKTDAIGQKITELLDSLTLDSFHTISYHYDKDAGLAGNYTAQSVSAIYIE